MTIIVDKNFQYRPSLVHVHWPVAGARLVYMHYEMITSKIPAKVIYVFCLVGVLMCDECI